MGMDEDDEDLTAIDRFDAFVLFAKAYGVESNLSLAVEKPEGVAVCYDTGAPADPEASDEDEETATWRKLIVEQMTKHDETWDQVVASTLDDAQLDRKFYDGYGGRYDEPAWTLWTVSRVYFPVYFVGASWVKSVARDPSDDRQARATLR